MFHFPKDTLNPEEIGPYCASRYISFEASGEYQVLVILLRSEYDEPEWIGESEGNLSSFIPLREDLMMGDYRLLYLTWLRSAFTAADYEDEEDDENDLKPPVPPSLQQLAPALEDFIRVFDIAPFLVQAAAEDSPNLQASQPVNTRGLVSRLSRLEADDFLTRLAEGDAVVRTALLKRLNEFAPEEKARVVQSRPIHELMARG